MEGIYSKLENGLHKILIFVFMVQFKHTTHIKCVTGVRNKQSRQKKVHAQYMNKSVHFQVYCMLMNFSCYTPTFIVSSLIAKSKTKNVIAIMT